MNRYLNVKDILVALLMLSGSALCFLLWSDLNDICVEVVWRHKLTIAFLMCCVFICGISLFVYALIRILRLIK